ncbi:MAG: hypothetical protein AB7I30_00120 [Isosphaeraceae bacterium]
MPARILVSNAGDVSEYWIQSHVTRIGEGPRLDVPIAGIGSHVATVEFRDGHYWIHNRIHHDLDLGGRPVRPAEPVVWRTGIRLALAPDLTLRLETDDDPTPGMPVVEGDDHALVEAHTDEVLGDADGPREPQRPRHGEPRGSQFVSLAVIAASLLAATGLPLSPKPGKATSEKAAKGFAELVIDLRAAERSAGDRREELREICRVLQAARSAEVRGDRTGARDLYSSLRDISLREDFSASGIPDALRADLLALLKAKL